MAYKWLNKCAAEIRGGYNWSNMCAAEIREAYNWSNMYPVFAVNAILGEKWGDFVGIKQEN